MERIYYVSHIEENRNKVLRVNDVAEEDEFDYPSERFVRREKPSIRNPVSESSNDEIIRRCTAAITGFDNNEDLFVEHMMRSLPNITHRNSEVWQSFGVNIAEADADINPLALVNPVVSNVHHDGVIAGGPVNQSDGMKLFWGLVSMYRVMLAVIGGNQQYTEAVATSVTRIFSSPPFGVTMGPYIAYARVNTIMADRSGYSMIVAMLDMFFTRFSKNKYASCRVSTIPTRRRALAALTGLSDVAEVAGVKPSGLIKFVFEDSVALDVMRITKDGEEIGDTHSYTNYLHDFKLVNRSPYSASANRFLNYWMHVIGTICGLMRSMNAMYIESVPASLINSAIISGHSLRKSVKTGIKFVSSAQEQGAHIQELLAELDDAAGREGTPAHALVLLQRNGGAVPAEIKNELIPQMAHLRNARPGTIGDCVRSFLEIPRNN